MQIILALSLLLPTLSQAAHVYLSPPSIAGAKTQRAKLQLSRHLGLEVFETLDSSYDHGSESFVGQGVKSALLLAIDSADAKHVIPSNLKTSFELTHLPSLGDLHSFVAAYTTRAEHVYSSIFSPSDDLPLTLDVSALSASPESSTFLAQFSALSAFLDSQDASSFAAIDMSGLSALRTELGADSEQYKSAVQVTRAAIASAMALSDKLHLAVVAYTPSLYDHTLARRASPSQAPLPSHIPNLPLPHEPVSGSSCFTSEDSCVKGTGNGTIACSGRGNCVKASKAGKTCFVCACGSTKSAKGKQEVWAGEHCERKDISGPFVMIAGTVIVLIILIYSSVSLLTSVGGEALPSTLLGGIMPSKKD